MNRRPKPRGGRRGTWSPSAQSSRRHEHVEGDSYQGDPIKSERQHENGKLSGDAARKSGTGSVSRGSGGCGRHVSDDSISAGMENLELVQVDGRSREMESATTVGFELQKDFHSVYKLSGLKEQCMLKSSSQKQENKGLDNSFGATDDRRDANSCISAVAGLAGNQSVKSSVEEKTSIIRTENPDCTLVGSSFDICPHKTGKVPKLKPSLRTINRIKRNEMKCPLEGPIIKILRPGMVLLKNHISFSDQVTIVNECRQLGLGRGGFYSPCYDDGGKLRLMMMCLGRHWDPQLGKYVDKRPIDDAKPPDIPGAFLRLVERAIQDSRNGSKNDNLFPPLSPNICIVNFYSSNGRLGLHQDKDESEGSLRRGLPVVSFSIGDSADFLYGDDRDTEKAAKVVLESGDILIFGGESRHIFHGVSAIHPKTAPELLLEQTDLRTGRLNLTFREY